MREIKFRAWDIEKTVMREDLLGAPYNALCREMELKDHEFARMLAGRYPGQYTVMQFTGLHDKNGREIYEGDVVRVLDTSRMCYCHDWEGCKSNPDECTEHGEHKHDGECDDLVCVQEVKWLDAGGFFCEEDTGNFQPPLGAEELELEVMGNIYENPELLERPFSVTD